MLSNLQVATEDRRRNAIVVALFFLMLGGGVASLAWLRYSHDLGFPLPVNSFYAQMEKIRPGMTVDEVRAQLSGVTRETTHLNPPCVSFSMEPKESGSLFRVAQHINIYLDENQRVKSITRNDG